MAKSKPSKPAKKPAKSAAKPAGKAADRASAKPKNKPAAPAKKPAPVKKSEAKKAPIKKTEAKKPETKKPEIKKPEAKKPEVKKVEGKKPDVKKPEAKGAPKVSAKVAEAPDTDKKPKGITVVEPPKPGSGRKPMKAKGPVVMPNLGPPLIGPGSKPPKPLIASGPKAPKQASGAPALESLKGKTHLSKKDLEHYRSVLLRKRGELAGDITTMEGQALNDSSGSLSHLPQHAAEQGSDAYDQSLSLEIAEVDRQLIREIDDALARIEDASFGLCLMTGKPIGKDRLDELPWTRYSIEAARERERKMFFVPRGTGEAPARSSGSAASSD